MWRPVLMLGVGKLSLVNIIFCLAFAVLTCMQLYDGYMGFYCLTALLGLTLVDIKVL